ncbi:MAG: AzlD domain-containing protein [Bacillota bacterium]
MRTEILILITGMALVTYIPRVLPLLILSKLDIPGVIIRWLKYIPAAILAALLAPNLFMIDGEIAVNLKNVNLLASIPTFVVAFYKKNIFMTIIVGVLSVIILKLF